MGQIGCTILLVKKPLKDFNFLYFFEPFPLNRYENWCQMFLIFFWYSLKPQTWRGNWKPLQKTRSCICTAQHCIVPKVRSSGGGGALRCSSRFVDGGARRRPLCGGGQLALRAPPRRPQRKRANSSKDLFSPTRESPLSCRYIQSVWWRTPSKWQHDQFRQNKS